jgi:PKD repeat protein
LLARANGSTSYRAKLCYLAGGSLALSVGRFVSGTETTLATTDVTGITATPGLPLRLRLEAEGSSPTTVRAKVWPVSGTEPATWTATARDATAGLQAAGTAGLDLYTSGSATAPSVLAFDRFTVSRLGVVQPPVNQPPVGVIGTPGVTGRAVTLSGTGSSDPDGTIASFAWNFGDGTTGTGATPSHTYGADGTYAVTLTVTDDKGATGTATRSVTVTAPPPAGVLARDAFARTMTNGWGSAEVGGAWTFSGAGNRYSVDTGAGRQTITIPGSTVDTMLTSVSSVATDMRLTIAWSRTASAGTLYASVLPRRVSSANDYRCKVVGGATGTIQMVLVRRTSSVETTVGSTTIAGVTLAANQTYNVACRAVPSGTSTQLTGKLWRTGTVEPASWQVSATDSTQTLQAAGGIGVSSYLSSGATTGVTLSVDDLVVTTP